MTLLEEIEAAAPTAEPLADLKLTPAPGAWAARAACVAINDMDSFIPASKPEPEELAVAVGVCRHCPVRQECTDYAAMWAVYGVWAGRWIDRTRPQQHAV